MRIRENRYEVRSPLVKTERKILVLTDVHAEKVHMDGLLEWARREKHDVCLIVGDVVNRVDRDNSETLAWIGRLAKILPVYVASGNHEFKHDGGEEAGQKHGAELLARIAKIPGCTLLRGVGKVDVESLGKDLAVGGLEIPDRIYTEKPSKIRGAFLEYSAEVAAPTFSSDKFNILLVHTPEVFFEKSRLADRKTDENLLGKVSLVLSGHMHGGLRPRFTRGDGKSRRGLFGPYKGLLPRNSFGFWTRKDFGLILSDGVTKLSRSMPVWRLNRVANLFFIPDVETIRLIPDEKFSITLKK